MTLICYRMSLKLPPRQNVSETNKKVSFSFDLHSLYLVLVMELLEFLFGSFVMIVNFHYKPWYVYIFVTNAWYSFVFIFHMFLIHIHWRVQVVSLNLCKFEETYSKKSNFQYINLFIASFLKYCITLVTIEY